MVFSQQLTDGQKRQRCLTVENGSHQLQQNHLYADLLRYSRHNYRQLKAIEEGLGVPPCDFLPLRVASSAVRRRGVPVPVFSVWFLRAWENERIYLLEEEGIHQTTEMSNEKGGEFR